MPEARDQLTIALVGSAGSGLGTVVSTLRTSIESGLHSLNHPGIPAEERLHLSVVDQPGSAQRLPPLEAYYSRMLQKGPSTGRTADDLLRAAAAPGAGWAATNPAFAFSLEATRPVSAGDGIGQLRIPRTNHDEDGSAAREWPAQLALSVEALAEENEAINVLAFRLLTEFSGVHLFISCEETGPGGQPDDLLKLVTSLCRLYRYLDEAGLTGSAVTLRGVTLGITQTDRAYLGRPPADPEKLNLGSRAWMHDDSPSLVDRIVMRRLQSRPRSHVSGDVEFERLITALLDLDDLLAQGRGASDSAASPVIPMSAFGGIAGTAGLNVEAVDGPVGVEGRGPAIEFLPRLLSVTCAALGAEEGIRVAVSKHEPFQVADGLIYLVRRCFDQTSPVDQLIPGTGYRTTAELCRLLGNRDLARPRGGADMGELRIPRRPGA